MTSVNHALRVLRKDPSFTAVANRVDPLIFVVLPLLLLLVTVLATWAPARLASPIDPMRVLREE